MATHNTKVVMNGEEVHFKTGHIAFKADSAVQVQVGETVILAVVTVDDKETDLDYFPLGVEYIEKYYAGGIISGSRFIKRETRPSEDAVLKARQIDHSIRSLFPKGFKRAVSVIITVLAYDEVHDPDDYAVTAASMALSLSSVPFDGPCGSVKVGIDKEGEMVINPRSAQDELDTKFIISARKDRILNIEGYANEISEDRMDEVLDIAVENIQPLLKVQEEFTEEVGKEKLPFEVKPVSADLINMVEEKYYEDIKNGLFEKSTRSEVFDRVATQIVEVSEDNEDEESISKSDADKAVEYIARKIMRSSILEEEKRTSGREMDEIRKLKAQVAPLPRVHGSALFSRGITQTLTVVTLASTRLSQSLESFEGEDEKRFMHHYNAPNYSFGDAGRFSYYAGRREIGHGHITESAFEKILPDVEEFPYTVRVVSEIMSQNGSSSMAAATATSLALMDAGVPIKEQVAGIAVGLVTNEEDESEYKLITDMEDVEDFYGDMDFKVVGTKNGITAIQLDNKIKGVPVNIMKAAIRKAQSGRMVVLETINNALPAPRKTVSENAPKVEKIVIDKDKIGEVIGPGGKMIRKITELTGGDNMDIDIQEDGTVYVMSPSADDVQKAIDLIKELAGGGPEVGKVYEGEVEKITDYGAFVAISPVSTGLLHVSEISDGFVKDVRKHLKEGEKVDVKVLGVDDQGKIKLSIKAIKK